MTSERIDFNKHPWWLDRDNNLYLAKVEVEDVAVYLENQKNYSPRLTSLSELLENFTETNIAPKKQS